MDGNEREGAAGAETSDIEAVPAPGRERRMTAVASGTRCCGCCGASLLRSLFGLTEHLEALSKHGDPLEVLDADGRLRVFPRLAGRGSRLWRRVQGRAAAV